MDDLSRRQFVASAPVVLSGASLLSAALAHGLKAEADFDVKREAIRVAMVQKRAELTSLFNSIPARQCTRDDYDSKPLSNGELTLLERAGTSKDVQMLLITERPAIEHVLDYVVQANTEQMADPAFVRERTRSSPRVLKFDGTFVAL